MNSGKKFEQNFANSVPEDVYFMRIKDSANNFQRGPQSHFATQNPFDCFVVYKGFFIPMELKSTQSKSFSIQSKQIEKGKDIKHHQIQSLLRASTYDGVIAGFVLDFRESNTYWINIKDFCEFNDNTTKKSINEQDVIEHNGILIHKTKLKVNYRYDVSGLIDYIVSTRG